MVSLNTKFPTKKIYSGDYYKYYLNTAFEEYPFQGGRPVGFIFSLNDNANPMTSRLLPTGHIIYTGAFDTGPASIGFGIQIFLLPFEFRNQAVRECSILNAGGDLVGTTTCQINTNGAVITYGINTIGFVQVGGWQLLPRYPKTETL